MAPVNTCVLSVFLNAENWRSSGGKLMCTKVLTTVIAAQKVKRNAERKHSLRYRIVTLHLLNLKQAGQDYIQPHFFRGHLSINRTKVIGADKFFRKLLQI